MYCQEGGREKRNDQRSRSVVWKTLSIQCQMVGHTAKWDLTFTEKLICALSVYYHQSRRLGHHRRVKGMCVGEVQDKSGAHANTTLGWSRRTRKRTHFDEFMYYDDWLGSIKKPFKLVPVLQVLNGYLCFQFRFFCVILFFEGGEGIEDGSK